ncbi:phage tail sheath family protein [Roseateles cellulosilyticus]|uniref:Phage tail sheath subtilisin-like domain-containing protein n=1 Tax=Pelomonas cellulosilytica TaxID=2906762 RepID=A0ABS8XSP9_9BURK|nr:phage tail sheath C-terminal domain-containing protein [Pelomonas sp. P8]MCE4554320.1 phage tail sheath subtilisin-like domain-containing protein [Pelomonas sp. P8]
MVMKTPGVYIVEKNAFPNSIVEVATAVPAFVGYTRRAENGGKSLRNKPWRISSMAEYHSYFGHGPDPKLAIEEAAANGRSDFRADGKDYALTQAVGAAGGRYLLYHGMVHFFQNGGGPCYVISVGGYDEDVDAQKLTDGITPLIKEQEPTMLVIPDAVLLKRPDCVAVQQAMLQHCGGKMRNRIAILDVWGGYLDRKDPGGDPIEAFRNDLGVNYLDFAAAYYPWVNTTVVQDKDLDYTRIANPELLATLLRKELSLPEAADPKTTPPRLAQQIQAVADITKTNADWEKYVTDLVNASTKTDEEKAKALTRAALDVAIETHKSLLHKSLVSMSPLYNTLMTEARNRLNLLPPSAAMAGVYTMVDNSRGVWKAPANVSLNGVISPEVSISHEEQEDLNVTTQGKSINAIRSFIGEGVLVWGARTLDGNSLDWRYINVRRTMIMLEESCRLAAKAMVFEPNVANTWVTIKSMISSFLTGIWKRGGLAGAVPEDAFSVHVGLGETMTSEDILEGILRVTVLVAISRPAEFIEITFQQQMQKS